MDKNCYFYRQFCDCLSVFKKMFSLLQGENILLKTMSNIDVLVEVCVSLANEQSPENPSNSKRQRLSSCSDSENDIEVQPSTSSIAARLPYRVNMSHNDDDDSSSEEDIDNEDRIAMELLAWQESQISRCIIDNTVNQAIESYLALIEANRAMGYGSDLEESAISVAIDEYGLLHQIPELEPITPNDSPDSSLHLANESTPKLTNAQSSSSSTVASTSSSSPSTSTTSTSDCQHKSDNPKPISNESAEDSDHDNVMEAAITAAIQKKGLSSYR